MINDQDTNNDDVLLTTIDNIRVVIGSFWIILFTIGVLIEIGVIG